MKRFIIASSSIFGVANPKKFVLDKLYSFTNQLSDHVIKCVVYQDASMDFDHWIHEIAVWLNAANKLRCKSKLRWRDYTDTLFASFGDELSDASWQLEDFRRRKCLYRSVGQYQDFTVTDELTAKLFHTYQQIMVSAKPWFMSQSEHSVSEWKRLVEGILL